MKKLLATTALVLATSLPAFAQTDATATDTMAADTTMSSPYVEGVQDGVRASDFIGKRVYLTEADTSGMSATAMADADTNWEDAGEISDLIMSLTGDTEVVLVDFGGFLGIGEKTVALDIRQLVMVPDSDSPDDYFIVFKGTKADLEGAPAFNPDMVFEATAPAGTDGAAMTDGTATTDTMATDTAATDAAATDAAATDAAATDAAVATDAATDTTAATGTSGEMVDLSAWTEGDLVGKRVYGPNEEDVGEISAVSLDANGKVAGAIVDVGGFLGMGEKKVALTSDMISLVKAEGGDRFIVNATQEQLEALAPYAE